MQEIKELKKKVAETTAEIALLRRNLEIEAALEKVRSRAMAMHKSDEFSEVMAVLFRQLQTLGLGPNYCYINIANKNAEWVDTWYTEVGGDYNARKLRQSIDDDVFFRKTAKEARKRNAPIFFSDRAGRQLDDYVRLLEKDPVMKVQGLKDFAKNSPSACLYQTNVFFRYGFVGYASFHPRGEHDAPVFGRFALVIEQTYTRFLDLQKAEAQAKEAQIEVALERVRSETMAMHSSDDVTSAITTMFTELEKLGVENLRCGIANINSNKTMGVWSVSNVENLKSAKGAGIFDMNAHILWQHLYEGWAKKEKFLFYFLKDKEKVDYIKVLNAKSNYLPQAIQQFPDMNFQAYYYSEGAIWTFSLQPHSEADKQLMHRFTSVFSLTFRRYQDLQKAEAQAREAQIEAALERVRSRTMAMHKSGEFSEVAVVLFQQLERLGIDLQFSYITITSKSEWVDTWYTEPGGNFNAKTLRQSIEEDVYMRRRAMDAREKKEPFFFSDRSGKVLADYIELLRKDSEIKIDALLNVVKEGPSACFYQTQAFFKYGFVGYASFSPRREEELQVLRRFALVIEQTYTRFLDLQRVEAQAREANIQAALEKVRAKAMAMHHSDELTEVVKQLYQEFDNLHINNESTDIEIGLIDEATGMASVWAHFYLSDGAISTFKFPLAQFHKDEYEKWKATPIDKRNELFFTTEMSGGEMIKLIEQVTTTSPELAEIFRPFIDAKLTKWVTHDAYFSHGILTLQGTEAYPPETLEIQKRFAKVFEQAYTRFLDLQIAEEQAALIKQEKERLEKTLKNLQATQAQLIQSEKLASLGELTAGIAHEIQNPLNFVNNFADLSVDLAEELKLEIGKLEIEAKDKEFIDELLGDLTSNQQKINHHGKRAASIVTGMLQHARTSSGTKEPTDLNALADEYLRLSYHGLRAKDSTYNAKMVTDFDPAIGKVEVISQDIGRVFLNLINNAFYATQQRKLGIGELGIGELEEPYEPTVSISSKKEYGQVVFKIKDNGTGIPNDVKAKIFQPFFTTKPTGQGTGLGLSLAYDIVTKGHGGTLEVETKAGEGTEFIISLPI